MYMIYHGDADDMLYDEPVFFETLSEAVDYANDRIKRPMHKRHALTLYECRERRVWEAPE